MLTFCNRQKSNKLDWMYAGPNANINGSNDNSMEEFLLGKKNVDELLRAKQREEVVSLDFLNMKFYKTKNNYFIASCYKFGRK